MKNLIFSHKSDIDGMGGIVLLKLSCKNVEYELCEIYNVDEKFQSYYNSKLIYDYDNIYITDLCLNNESLDIIKNDEILTRKVKVFDHHKSVEKYNSYDFVNVVVKDEKGLCCGTTVFYKYLLETGILKNNLVIDEFCELTRRYDTWEWKNIYDDEKSRDLSLLFETVGAKKYIELMCKKLKENEEFKFSEFEIFLIENKKNNINEKVVSYVQNIVYKEIDGLKAGIVFIAYEYRNEVAQYLIDKKYDIDFVMLIAVEHNSISFRTIKPGVNVRLVAEKMGGKGHDSAAGKNITLEEKSKILELFI